MSYKYCFSCINKNVPQMKMNVAMGEIFMCFSLTVAPDVICKHLLTLGISEKQPPLHIALTGNEYYMHALQIVWQHNLLFFCMQGYVSESLKMEFNCPSICHSKLRKMTPFFNQRTTAVRARTPSPCPYQCRTVL